MNKESALNIAIAKKLLPSDVEDLDLTPRDYKFVAEYCTNGFKGPEAASQAGYSGTKKTLQSTAWKLMKNPAVSEAIKRFINTVIEPYKTRLEFEILDRYYRRATYDVSMFFFPDGTVKPLDIIPQEWLQIIDGVELKSVGSGALATIVTSYKLPDRDTALQTLLQLVTGGSKDGKNIPLPGDSRARLLEIFNAGLIQRTGGDVQQGTITKTTLTLEQTVKTEKEPGRPRKYCRLVKGQPCIHCNRCKTAQLKRKEINVTPELKKR